MDQVIIREYRESDLIEVSNLVDEFQDYLISLDHLSRMRRLPSYGTEHTNSILKEVGEQSGKLLLATDNNRVIGLIAGTIKLQTPEDLLESNPTVDGRVTELYVSPSYRNSGIGKILMEKMEAYLIERGCNAIRIFVFESNVLARNFYEKLGYEERLIDLIKIVKD